jgi:ATP-dependent exoDNAse (exonuclease V) beta subunit
MHPQVPVKLMRLYLKILVRKNFIVTFLAITFTNKAVHEMKIQVYPAKTILLKSAELMQDSYIL